MYAKTPEDVNTILAEEAEETFEPCQWENCSGGRYCQKHSLEQLPDDGSVY